MKKRIIRVLVILVIGIAVIAITGVGLKNPDGSNYNKLEPVAAGNFGGAYTLTNHMGESVTDQTYSGQYQLIYFGFTYCPAICPTELSKMTTVLNELGAEADQIQPLFISVDPERDTVDVMKNYVSLFHPRFIGLTGTVEQIEAIKKAYKVYSAKVDDPQMTEYTVDHSSYIYFMDPEGQLLGLYKITDTAEKGTENIRAWLKKNSTDS